MATNLLCVRTYVCSEVDQRRSVRDQWRSDQPENSERSRGDQSEISGIQPEINVISVEIRERSGRDQ